MGGCRDYRRTPVGRSHRGLDFGSLVKANPRLVYCAITGYGEQGPWSGFPRMGCNLMPWLQFRALGLGRRRTAGSRPLRIPRTKSLQVLGRRSGYSRRCTTATLKASLNTSASQCGRRRWSGSGGISRWRRTSGRRLEGYQDLGSRYRMYRTGDDRAILVCPSERKYWEALPWKSSACRRTGKRRALGPLLVVPRRQRKPDYPEEPEINPREGYV